jgi:uncharacterized protein (DUF697 family)
MAYEMETEEYEADQFETDGEGEYESDQFLGGLLGGVLGETDSPLSEVEEMEYASQLLEISDEAELEEFLGGLIKKAAQAVGGFVKSPVGKALGGVLKNVAKKALPVVGGALGSFVAPGVGTAIGSKLGSMASNLFELELESMDQEEAEFEVARRMVRLTASAAKNAATAPRTAPPKVVVRKAIVNAAKQHAPGLIRSTTILAPSSAYGGSTIGGAYRPRHRSGRWIRRGSKIVVFGA